MGYTIEKKHLNHRFQNCKPFRNGLKHYRRIRDPNMTQNERVYAICCQTEVGDDVISSRTVKTMEGYVVVNFEVAGSNSFRDIPKNTFA